MTTAQDVQLALLAFDAYSRGDNPMMTDLNNTSLATTIGTASFMFTSSEEMLGSASSGFSASKYTLSSGETVISYRGTDFDLSSASGVAALIADMLGGWLSSFGVLPAQQLAGSNLQPGYAAEFYQLVTGQPLFGTPGNSSPSTPSNLMVTGHSQEFHVIN